MCFARRRRALLRGVLSAALLAIVALGATGCNGGGTTVPAVGRQSFAITVTATPTGSAGTASPQPST